MTYELECGHCGYQFTLDRNLLTHSVKCPVCGGTLTVAVAVPKAPEPPTSPPRRPTPAPAPSLPPPPPAKPARRDPAELDPELRAARLAEPWRTVRKGLSTARTATDFAFPPYICFVTFALAVSPFVPAEDQRGIIRLLWITAVAHLLPTAIHVAGQFACTAVPQSHGARLVRVSLWVLGLALLLLLAYDVPRGGRPAFLVCAVLVFVSFGLWLAFLNRLGMQFGDRKLIAESQRYLGFFLTGVFGSFMLFGFTEAARQAGSPVFVWLGQAGAGAVGFFLLFWYSVLLRTATQAIDRHAPLTP